MRRYWMAGSLLLLAGVAGFWLPSVMMEWQDEARIGKIETERAEEVILTVQTEMSLLEKLNLMTGGTVNTLELDNGKNYSRDNIAVKMQEEVRKLENLGLLDLNGQQLDYSGAEVQFLVDTQDGARSLVLWNVDGSTEDYELVLVMDDETGKILNVWQNERITYAAEAWTDVTAETVDEETMVSEQEKMAEAWGEYLGCALVKIYQTELELLDERSEYEMGIKNEVEALVKAGMSEEDAYRKTYGAWGFPEGMLQNRFFAEYQDEKGTVTYLFRFLKENVVFSAELFM